MRQFRQLVTRRQRILSRCGELRSTKLREGLTIRPRVLEPFLRWLTKLAPGLANTQAPLDTQPDLVAGQFEALSHRTGQAAVRQKCPLPIVLRSTILSPYQTKHE